MIKIGITGIIGSGKTSVCNILNIAGVPVYNADINAKLLINSSSEIKNSLINRYGDDIYISGVINKKKLSGIIFENSKEREFVNKLVHPVVINDFLEWSESQSSEIVSIESALIYESKLNKYLDSVILVKSPYYLRLKRIIERDKISKAEAEKRISAQKKEELLEEISDYIIMNDEKNSLILQTLSISNKLKG